MSGTVLAHVAMRLRARYAMSSTDLAYGALPDEEEDDPPVYPNSPKSLRARYAMPGPAYPM
eukprot:367342-Rhodomonas_salina.1